MTTGWGRALAAGCLAVLGAAFVVGGQGNIALAQGAPTWTPLPETPYRLYRLHCVSCHGDALLGLTPEWIAKWPVEDQNCWNPKCHGLNHPPDGFTIPRTAPALAGPGSLVKFRTAADLFAFVKAAMPYQEPGHLSDEQYYKILEYVLDRNGIQIPQGGLSPSNASDIVIRGGTNGEASDVQTDLPTTPEAAPPHLPTAAAETNPAGVAMDPRIAAIAVALGAVIGVALFLRRRRSAPPGV